MRNTAMDSSSQLNQLTSKEPHPKPCGRSPARLSRPPTHLRQAVFGYGLWNERSLTDSARDVMFSLATNTALSTGLTKESVPFKPADTFPYVPVTG